MHANDSLLGRRHRDLNCRSATGNNENHPHKKTRVCTNWVAGTYLLGGGEASPPNTVISIN